MLADLHCHYPMHLLARSDPGAAVTGWLARARAALQADLLDVAAVLLTDPPWGPR